MSIELNAIAAMCDLNKGIGKNNDLPWSLPDDFKYVIN
jgi:dihydrofolate reductase